MIKSIRNEKKTECVNTNALPVPQNENINGDRRIILSSNVPPIVENQLDMNSLAVAAVRGSAAVGNASRNFLYGEDPVNQERNDELLEAHNNTLKEIKNANKQIKQIQNKIWWCNALSAGVSCAGVVALCYSAFRSGVGASKSEGETPPNSMHIKTPTVTIGGGEAKIKYPDLGSYWKGSGGNGK